MIKGTDLLCCEREKESEKDGEVKEGKDDGVGVKQTE